VKFYIPVVYKFQKSLPVLTSHTIIIIMSVVALGTRVVYKSSPAFSVPGDKPEITPAVLLTFIQ
jgi:hypothetical protein